MADDGGRLRVGVCDAGGRPVGARGLASWLVRVAPARARGHVNIAIVSDARVRRLNRTYLRKDYATDVLSFPSSDRARRRPPALSRGSRVGARASGRFLGDIVIARGVAERQARRAGHPASTELRVLALHGLLHLLGYDHERDEGRMRRVEGRLRQKGGLGEGLIERQSTTASSAEAGGPRRRPVPDTRGRHSARAPGAGVPLSLRFGEPGRSLGGGRGPRARKK